MYEFDGILGTWRYQGLPARLKKRMVDWRFSDEYTIDTISSSNSTSFGELCRQAEVELRKSPTEESSEIELSKSCESLCWFRLPQQAATALLEQPENSSWEGEDLESTRQKITEAAAVGP